MMRSLYAEGSLLLFIALPWLVGCGRSGTGVNDLSGSWTRPTELSCTAADIDISPLSGNLYALRGTATWCPSEEEGERGVVHVGELDFTLPLVDGALRYEDPDSDYSIVVRLTGEGLEVVEEGAVGYHGLSVTFNGTYRRIDG